MAPYRTYLRGRSRAIPVRLLDMARGVSDAPRGIIQMNPYPPRLKHDHVTIHLFSTS